MRAALPFGAVLGIALVARIPLYSYESYDFHVYLNRWLIILRRDGISALATDFSNYSPPYLYALWLGSLTPLSNLVVVKLISTVFDVVLASAAAWLVATTGAARKKVLVAFALMLLGPTVVLNSALWGQCDAGYTLFTLAAIPLLIRGDHVLCMVAIGLGVAFKLQTVFFLPVLGLLTLRGAFPWRHWALLPIPYLVSIVVPFLYGRPLLDLLFIFADQAREYPFPTLNAPTLFAWLDFDRTAQRAGVIAGGLILAAASLAFLRWEPVPSRERLIAFSAFFLVLVPFCLPSMHERYFFAGDVLTIVYAVLAPRRWFVAVLVSAGSAFSYAAHLRADDLVPLEFSACLMAAAIAVLAWDVYPTLRHSLAAWAPWPATGSGSND